MKNCSGLLATQLTRLVHVDHDDDDDDADDDDDDDDDDDYDDDDDDDDDDDMYEPKSLSNLFVSFKSASESTKLLVLWIVLTWSNQEEELHKLTVHFLKRIWNRALMFPFQRTICSISRWIFSAQGHFFQKANDCGVLLCISMLRQHRPLKVHHLQQRTEISRNI